MDHNPYAAPEASDDDAPAATGGADFTGSSMSVLLLLLLCVVTFGLFQPIWFFMRRRFLDSLDGQLRFSVVWPVLQVVLFACGAAVALGAAVGSSKDLGQVGELAFRAGGIVGVVACFRARRLLIRHHQANGSHRSLSGVATFFFGVLYLQHTINNHRNYERTVDRPMSARRRVQWEGRSDPEGEARLRRMNEALAREQVKDDEG